MAKVSSKVRALADRVAALETAIDAQRTEIRTRRVTVVDDRRRSIAVIEARDGAGLLEVRRGESCIRLDAGSLGHPVLDVLSGVGADGVGIHLYADHRDDAVGIASSRKGDITADRGL